MTDLIYDSIAMAVDMVLSAVILSGLVVLLYTSSSLTSVYARSTMNAETIRQYREYAAIDRKESTSDTITGSDVISIIIRYHGECPIKVRMDTDTYIISESNRLYLLEGSTETDIDCTQTAVTTAGIKASDTYRVGLYSIAVGGGNVMSNNYVPYDGTQPIALINIVK